VAFLEGRLLTSQSEQFKKYSKSSDCWKKVGPPKNPLLFWSCKQTNRYNAAHKKHVMIARRLE